MIAAAAALLRMDSSSRGFPSAFKITQRRRRNSHLWHFGAGSSFSSPQVSNQAVTSSAPTCMSVAWHSFHALIACWRNASRLTAMARLVEVAMVCSIQVSMGITLASLGLPRLCY